MHWRRIPPDEGLEALLFFGVRLHGHLGPFMVAGLKMGALALRLLDHPGYQGIDAEVETGTAPPVSCLVDGIQISSGCTAGKGNLRIRDGGVPRATFHVDGKTVRITLKKRWAKEFGDTAEPEELARRVLYLPEEELFEWEISP